MESKSALSHMAQLESRSDEELEAETRFKAAAQAILGARAAERMDAERAREHFRAAIAASRPQERMQLRRMAEASLALAERRVDDLKVATERLGQPAPTGRQLLALRFLGLVAPPKSRGRLARVRGILIVLALIVGLLAIGWGLVMLISLPFGGLDSSLAIFWGFLLVVVAVVALIVIGRRRQKAARARIAEKRQEQARSFGAR